MTAMEEQETTVVTQIRNGDPLIYTANPVHIRALDKRVAEGRATVRRTWTVEDRVEAREYSIPAGTFDPLKGFQADSEPRVQDADHTPQSQARELDSQPYIWPYTPFKRVSNPYLWPTDSHLFIFDPREGYEQDRGKYPL